MSDMAATTSPRRWLRTGLVVLGIGVASAALGVGAFQAARALAAPGEDPDATFVVPLATPVLTTELAPGVPLEEVLGTLDEQLVRPAGDPVGDPAGTADGGPDASPDVPPSATRDGAGAGDVAPGDGVELPLPASGPAPAGIRRGVQEVDLRASGGRLLTAEQLGEAAASAGADGLVAVETPTAAGPVPLPGAAPATDELLAPERSEVSEGDPSDASDDDPPDAVASDPPDAGDGDTPELEDDARIVLELDVPAVVDLAPDTVPDEPSDAPDADEEREQELDLHWDLDLDRIVEVLPRLLPPEPDFLDVCAARFGDDLPGDIDCEDGTGATVLPINTIPDVGRLRVVGYDAGPRCADHVDVDSAEGFPVRMTFGARPQVISVVYEGLGDPAFRGQELIRTDPERASVDGFSRLFDQCVLIPYSERDDRVALTIEYPRNPVHRVELSVPTREPDWPPTVVETIGDRTVQVKAPTRDGIAVRATIITRSASLPGLRSQCGLVGSEDLTEAAAQVTELRPAGAHWYTPPRLFGGEVDRYERFLAQLQGGPERRFELCLRWERQGGAQPQVVRRESFLLDPPPRPIVEIAVGPGTFLLPEEPDDRHPHAITLAFVPDGDGPGCILFRRLAELEDDLPRVLCHLEVIDGLAGGALQLAVHPEAGPGPAGEVRSFRVRLPTDPSHPRSGERCVRCADVFEFPLRGLGAGARQIGNVQVVVATTTPPADRGWVTLRLPDDPPPPRAEVPQLDVRRTRITARSGGISDRRADARHIAVDVVADRPVRARLWARPQRVYAPGNPTDPPCGPLQVPAASAISEGFASEVRVQVDGVCPGTRYRLALELWDEEGNRSVHGEAWTARMIAAADPGGGLRTADGADEPAPVNSYAHVGEWREVTTVPGWALQLRSEVRIMQVHVDDALEPGIYREDPWPSGAGSREPGFPFEAQRTRVHLAELVVGRIGLSSGAHTGDDGCVDGGRTLRAGPREGQVSHWMPVEARVVLHTLAAPTMAFSHCQGEVAAVRELRLSSYSASGRLAGRHVVSPWELTQRDGEPVYVVAVSEPAEFDDRHGFRFQAVFRIEVPR